jgi:hypothetical protein
MEFAGQGCTRGEAVSMIRCSCSPCGRRWRCALKRGLPNWPPMDGRCWLHRWWRFPSSFAWVCTGQSSASWRTGLFSWSPAGSPVGRPAGGRHSPDPYAWTFAWGPGDLLAAGDPLCRRDALPGAQLVPALRAAEDSRKRVAIYGAGSAGTQLAYALRAGREYLPVAFVRRQSRLCSELRSPACGFIARSVGPVIAAKEHRGGAAGDPVSQSVTPSGDHRPPRGLALQGQAGTRHGSMW